MSEVSQDLAVIKEELDSLSMTFTDGSDPWYQRVCDWSVRLERILSLLEPSPAEWKWYLGDEPGCPNNNIAEGGFGYCQGTLYPGGNYNNVAILANYIASIDGTHQTITDEVGEAGNASNMYSWLVCPSPTSCPSPQPGGTSTPNPTNSPPPIVTYDFYWISSTPQPSPAATAGAIASQIASVITSENPSAGMGYVGQAFAWYQESGAGCSSITLCSFPTTTQMQAMRDNALSGYHPAMIFWYYWPDVTCLNTYTGCNSATNQAALRAAAFAPYPSAP